MSGFVIAKNAALNIAAFAVTLLVTFLLVPVMLAHLGAAGFGVWAIARVFVSYASLSDLGLSSTVTKFVAEFHTKRDEHRLALYLQAAFMLYTLIGILLFLCVWLFSDLLVATFFAGSGSYAADVQFVLLGSIAVFAVNLVGTVFSSAINGLQRMEVTNGLTTFYWLLNGGGMFAALEFGYGLRGIVYANALSTALLFVLLAVFFFRLFARVPFLSVRFRFDEIVESLRYGKDIFIIAVANSVHLHYDKLLLGSFVGVGAVSNYEIASRVIQAMRQIVVLVLNPMLPLASELQAVERTESIRRLYARAMKFLVFFTVPFFACTAAFAGELIELWLRESNAVVVLTLQTLLFANFVNLLTGPAYFISLGIGKARYGMYCALVGLALNLLLSFAFLRLFGYVGLLAGTSVALLCEAILFLVIFQGSLDLSLRATARLLLQPSFAILAGVGAGLGIGSFTDSLVVKTLLMFAVTIVIYFLLMIKLHYFDEEDRTFLKELKGMISTKLLQMNREKVRFDA